MIQKTPGLLFPSPPHLDWPDSGQFRVAPLRRCTWTTTPAVEGGSAPNAVLIFFTAKQQPVDPSAHVTQISLVAAVKLDDSGA